MSNAAQIHSVAPGTRLTGLRDALQFAWAFILHRIDWKGEKQFGGWLAAGVHAKHRSLIDGERALKRVSGSRKAEGRN